MKRFFDFFPTLIWAAWLTRKDKGEIAVMIRMSLLILVASALTLSSGISDAYHAISDRIDRHKIGVQKRIKYPALIPIFNQYDECYGSLYSIFKDSTKWIECDLTAIENATSLGIGHSYTAYAAERDADIEFAGFKLYPVPEGPPLPPPR